MKTSSKLGMYALGALLVSTAGCSKKGADHDPYVARSPDAPASGSGTLTPASRARSAAEQIAQARCEREETCGNIGADKSYTSTQDCLARVQSDWRDDLNARDCPGGINQQELNECVQQVRGEACSNPFDTLARITECTSGQICIEQP